MNRPGSARDPGHPVPHDLIDTRVWARFHGDELIVTAVEENGSAREVARHHRGQPGPPVRDDAHYPPREDEEPTTPREPPQRKRRHSSSSGLAPRPG